MADLRFRLHECFFSQKTHFMDRHNKILRHYAKSGLDLDSGLKQSRVQVLSRFYIMPDYWQSLNRNGPLKCQTKQRRIY